jgi:DNA-binding HxlR family transcriptional regulator
VIPPGGQPARRSAGPPACCPLYHEAIELVGKRWTGAIVHVLMAAGSLRFSEISSAVPELSDRLLSQRMKELEHRGLVRRRVIPGTPVRVEYELTPMGRDLEVALGEIQTWARRWLAAQTGPERAGAGRAVSDPAEPPARRVRATAVVRTTRAVRGPSR